MKDDDPARKLVITPDAFRDLSDLKALGLSKQDAGKLLECIKRVAKLQNVTDDKWVCVLRFSECDHEQVYRLKCSHLAPSVRVPFTVDETTMAIFGFFSRDDNTYRRIECRWRIMNAK